MRIKSKYNSINIEYLKNVSPEMAYDWIIENYSSEEMEFSNGNSISIELTDLLLERNSPLINLALAHVCEEKHHLQNLWDLNNRAIHIAIASNSKRGNCFGDKRILLEKEWIRLDDLIKKINQTPRDSEFIEAYCTNPRLKGEQLANLILRKDCYSEIKDDNYIYVVYFALNNPNIKKPSEGIEEDCGYDGHNGYLNSKAIQAAWSVLVYFPSDLGIAYDLYNVFNHIRRFEVPQDVLVEKGIISKDKKTGSDLIFLEYLLSKWKDSSINESETASEHFSFQLLRQNIASKIPTHKDNLMQFIKEHPDKFVRMGYYQIFNPDIESINRCYELDGYDFLDSIIWNKKIYYKGPIRDKIRSLIEDHKSPDSSDGFDDHLLRTNWDKRAELLHSKNPKNYPSSSDLISDSLSDRDDSIITNTQPQMIDNYHKSIKALVKWGLKKL